MLHLKFLVNLYYWKLTFRVYCYKLGYLRLSDWHNAIITQNNADCDTNVWHRRWHIKSVRQFWYFFIKINRSFHSTMRSLEMLLRLSGSLPGNGFSFLKAWRELCSAINTVLIESRIKFTNAFDWCYSVNGLYSITKFTKICFGSL